MKYAALLMLLLAGTASANGLDDLKSALASLQGQGALRGTYDAHQSKVDLEHQAKGPENANATAYVEEDANGFQMRWDRALLKRAFDETNPPKGVKKNDALSNLIGGSTPSRMEQVVNYAPKLLQQLGWAQLKSERADTYQGKPARMLEVLVTPPDEDDAKVNMKENSHLAQIWIGADGMPLAANVTHRIKASYMVFLSYEEQSKEAFVFNVASNRLVVLKREEQGTRKGFGSDSSYHNVYTFTPKA